MRRKEKRQHKKRLKRLLLPAILICITGIVFSGVILFPRIKSYVTGRGDVKSAYVRRISKSEVEKKLKEEKIEYTSVEFADEGEAYKITLKNNILVKISSSKSISQQVGTLHDILRRITIDNKQVKEIDLTFTRPVVKY